MSIPLSAYACLSFTRTQRPMNVTYAPSTTGCSTSNQVNVLQCEANGQPASHDEAKKLLAGFAAAFVFPHPRLSMGSLR